MRAIQVGRHVALIAGGQRHGAVRHLSVETAQTQPSSSSLIPPPSRTTPVSQAPPRDRPRPSTARRQSLPAHFGHNQRLAVSSDIDRDCQRVVASFKAPIRYAFSYGSGVFPQRSYRSTDQPMLDFIFAVSHPSHWHSINLQQNKHHYTAPLRWFGSGPISWLQTSGPGAGVWFNVGIEIDGRRVKYGVTSIDTLCRDLLDWETMYIAGRMHKPVLILRDDDRVRLANQVNLTSAIRTALLLLPERFTEYDLFVAIAGLSYHGDFRMAWGEHPRKIQNIVEEQMTHFRTIYGPLIGALKRHVTYTSGSTNITTPPPPLGTEMRTLEQDLSPASRGELVRKLPKALRDKIEEHFQRDHSFQQAMSSSSSSTSSTASEEETKTKEAMSVDEQVQYWSNMAQHSKFEATVERSVTLIVKRPTLTQSLKGIASVGPWKSIQYIIPKLRKRWGNSTS